MEFLGFSFSILSWILWMERSVNKKSIDRWPFLQILCLSLAGLVSGCQQASSRERFTDPWWLMCWCLWICSSVQRILLLERLAYYRWTFLKSKIGSRETSSKTWLVKGNQWILEIESQSVALHESRILWLVVSWTCRRLCFSSMVWTSSGFRSVIDNQLYLKMYSFLDSC